MFTYIGDRSSFNTFIFIGLRVIQKSSKRMWLSNMIGGIIFSQLQTEYLIWRINKKTEQATK